MKERLESLYVQDAASRLPFKAFVAWVQLELYRRHFQIAEELINNYIMKSTHLADPRPQRRLQANGNEDLSAEEVSSENEEYELPSKGIEDGMNPAQRAQRMYPGLQKSKTMIGSQ